MNTKPLTREGALVDQYELTTGKRSVKLLVADGAEIKPGDVIVVVDYEDEEAD